ncbi:unnamed protein product, partial [Lymnaea stagnalis]
RILEQTVITLTLFAGGCPACKQVWFDLHIKISHLAPGQILLDTLSALTVRLVFSSHLSQTSRCRGHPIQLVSTLHSNLTNTFIYFFSLSSQHKLTINVNSLNANNFLHYVYLKNLLLFLTSDQCKL